MTLGLALLGGVMGAALEPDLGGFAVGALLGALLGQVLHLRDRAHALELEVRTLSGALASRSAPPAEFRAPAPLPPAPEIPAAVAEAPSLSPPPAVEFEEREWTPPAASAAQAPSAVERAVAGFIAWLRRGNPVARAGIVVLFFGAAFLAKYAADNSLFPVELRFMALALGACALLIVGWRLRERRAVYAQLLQGGGVAGLYLTVFAATRLYELLPLGFAFALMVAVALAAAVLAVAQSAPMLAVIGTAGGFLAPILVSSGEGNHLALFSYYAVLNLGVFAVAWFKTWRLLNVLGFVFTFSVTALWRATGYEPHELAGAEAFLILFFLMYVGVSVLNCVRQPPNLRGYVSGTLVFGLPVVAFTLHATMVARIEYALAWSALGLGAFYLLLGWSLLRTRRESFRLLVESFAALGIVFASLAIPLAFDTRTTAAMWAVEGAGLLWLGVRQQRKLPRAFGALLQGAGGVGYLLGLADLQSSQPFLNGAYLGAVMLGASGVFSAYWLFRNREHCASYERRAEESFAIWGLAWWLFAGLQETGRHFSGAALGLALGYVAATAVVLAIIGRHRRWPLAPLIALVLPALATTSALLLAVSLHHPFARWGAAGWLAIFASHLWLLRRAELEPRALGWLHAGFYWALALVLAWELDWQIGRQTAGVWSALSWGFVPAFLIAWLGRRELVPRWPLAAYADAYRVRGAVPLVTALAVWVVGTNLTSAGDPVWLPYLPLLNPLDICVAVALAAVAFWWSALDASQRVRVWHFEGRALAALVTAVAFIWLNAALIRALHHNWGTPLTMQGVATSTLVQASLSIFWGVLGFAAMTLAARRGWRQAWMAGAGLMIIVVAKLFLIDLSNIGTVARIASFLTVGLLLLVTGYLAPLPPRRQST